MSDRSTDGATPFRIIRRITRDLQVPLFEGGEDLARHGWRCIRSAP